MRIKNKYVKNNSQPLKDMSINEMALLSIRFINIKKFDNTVFITYGERLMRLVTINIDTIS